MADSVNTEKVKKLSALLVTEHMKTVAEDDAKRAQIEAALTLFMRIHTADYTLAPRFDNLRDGKVLDAARVLVSNANAFDTTGKLKLDAAKAALEVVVLPPTTSVTSDAITALDTKISDANKRLKEAEERTTDANNAKILAERGAEMAAAELAAAQKKYDDYGQEMFYPTRESYGILVSKAPKDATEELEKAKKLKQEKDAAGVEATKTLEARLREQEEVKKEITDLQIDRARKALESRVRSLTPSAADQKTYNVLNAVFDADTAGRTKAPTLDFASAKVFDAVKALADMPNAFNGDVLKPEAIQTLLTNLTAPPAAPVVAAGPAAPSPADPAGATTPAPAAPTAPAPVFVTSTAITKLDAAIKEADARLAAIKTEEEAAKAVMDAAKAAYDAALKVFNDADSKHGIDEAAAQALVNDDPAAKLPATKAAAVKATESLKIRNAAKEEKDRLKSEFELAEKTHKEKVAERDDVNTEITKLKISRANEAIAAHMAVIGSDPNAGKIQIALNALLNTHTADGDNPPTINFADLKVLDAAKALAGKVDESLKIPAADIAAALKGLTGGAAVAPAADAPGAGTAPSAGGKGTRFWNAATGAWEWTVGTASQGIEVAAGVYGDTVDATSDAMTQTGQAMDAAAKSASAFGKTMEVPDFAGGIAADGANFVSGAFDLGGGLFANLWGDEDNPNKKGRGLLGLILGITGAAVGSRMFSDYMSKMPIVGGLPWGLGAMVLLCYTAYTAVSGKPGQAGLKDQFAAAGGATPQPTVTTTFTVADGTQVHVDALPSDEARFTAQLPSGPNRTGFGAAGPLGDEAIQGDKYHLPVNLRGAEPTQRVDVLLSARGQNGALRDASNDEVIRRVVGERTPDGPNGPSGSTLELAA